MIPKENLKSGDKLIANFTEKLTDYVTKGEIYEISKVGSVGFFITNDLGKECFPISATFKIMK